MMNEQRAYIGVPNGTKVKYYKQIINVPYDGIGIVINGKKDPYKDGQWQAPGGICIEVLYSNGYRTWCHPENWIIIELASLDERINAL